MLDVACSCINTKDTDKGVFDFVQQVNAICEQMSIEEKEKLVELLLCRLPPGV